MTYYPDFIPYPVDQARFSEGSLVTVGWLADKLPDAEEHPEGRHFAAPDDVVEKLVHIHLADTPRFTPYYFGYHPCGLCPNAPPKTETSVHYNGKQLSLGCGELLVPAVGFVFVAPNLIIHYLIDHGYRPDLDFYLAVTRCPPPETREYRDAVRANGPPAFRWDIEDPERPRWRQFLRPLVQSVRLQRTTSGRRLIQALRVL